MPFVCGCRDLGEALRRIGEGAAMIRTKGEAGTGDIVEAVRHMRAVWDGIRRLQNAARRRADGRGEGRWARRYELVKETKELGRLPVVNFAAGGVATPADAALMMQLGADGVFVGSGIFKSEDPAPRGARHRARRSPTTTTRPSSPRSRAASASRCAARAWASMSAGGDSWRKRGW